jgi:hypothetical protein
MTHHSVGAASFQACGYALPLKQLSLKDTCKHDSLKILSENEHVAKKSEIQVRNVNVRVINHCHQFPQSTKNAADKKICTGTENKDLYNV